MKKIFTSILLIFCITTLISQNDSLSLELDTYILNEMATQNIPGLSACIVKGEQVVWEKAYGKKNLATNEEVSLQTQFTLASISKLFTATAVAQLWENNQLDLDANINDYLPITVVNPNHPSIPITTRQLLTHKSSLKDSETDLQIWDAPGDPIYSLEYFCEEYFINSGVLYVASNYATTAPGSSSYWYSNAGFTLLGYLVEEISGEDFNTYCKNHILTPLDMNTTGWFYSETDSNNLAMPYNSSLQPYGYYSVPEYPAAMLKSNVIELSNFLIAYTQKGVFNNTEIVNSTTFSSIVPNNMNNGFGWWGADTWYGDASGTFWSHGGFMNGVRTQLNYYPQDSTGLIILTNGQGSYANIQNRMESYIPLFKKEVVEEPEPSSISNIETDFKIFPNPLIKDKILIFDLKGNFDDFKIEIYNQNGKIIIDTQDSKVPNQFDFSKHSAGVYYLKIYSKVGVNFEKIVVQ